VSSWAQPGEVAEIRAAIIAGDYKRAADLIEATELGPQILAELRAEGALAHEVDQLAARLDHAVVSLTPVELQVLRHASNGLRNRETAEAMKRSIETVKTHRKHAIEKLGAKNTANAVAIAVRAGLIE
jgi:DNA-binding CsgD family transcriptional regulator